MFEDIVLNRELIKNGFIYLSISLFATLLDIFLLFLFIDMFYLHYILAATLSYSMAVISKFWLNRVTVFRNRIQEWYKQMSKFVTVSIMGLIMTNIIMFIGVDLIKLTYLISKLISIGIVFFVTLLGHNFFSFSTKF